MAENRSATCFLTITRGAVRRQYYLDPVRPEGLAAEEMRAWIWRHSPPDPTRPAYRTSLFAGGLVTCTCPAATNRQPCKHSDWLASWGLVPSADEIALASRRERYITDLERHNEQLQSHLEELEKALQQTRDRADLAQEDLERVQDELSRHLEAWANRQPGPRPEPVQVPQANPYDRPPGVSPGPSVLPTRRTAPEEEIEEQNGQEEEQSPEYAAGDRVLWDRRRGEGRERFLTGHITGWDAGRGRFRVKTEDGAVHLVKADRLMAWDASMEVAR